jgi:hypothetical protein
VKEVEQLERRLPVGEAVVELEQVGRASVVESLDQYRLPQRASAVER